MPIRSRTLRNKHNKQVGWYRNARDRHHLGCTFGFDTRNSSFRKGEPGCRFRRASRIVSRVGVSRSDLVCSMIKISFKNVSQKNVSITIFVFDVKNVDLIPIRDARGNRTLDIQLSDDGVHPNAGWCRFLRAPRIVSGSESQRQHRDWKF